jgi:outer membrane protein OmpA-like peptidoglycan-associated protein
MPAWLWEGVLVLLVANEIGGWTEWLARRLVRWSARVRYASSPYWSDMAEEWERVVIDRPDQVLKLLTAACFALAAIRVRLSRLLAQPAVGSLRLVATAYAGTVTLATTITATAALTLYSALTLPGASPALPAASPLSGASVMFTNVGPLGFETDTAQFRDPAAAETALTQFAEYLAIHPSAEIEVSGTTARVGDLAYDIRLSLARAEAVRNDLVSLGSAPSRILTHGLGWQFPGYVNDQSPNGTLRPGPAEQNRSIIITPL